MISFFKMLFMVLALFILSLVFVFGPSMYCQVSGSWKNQVCALSTDNCQDEISFCMRNLALYEGERNSCERVQSKIQRALCYWEAGIKAKDERICNSIVSINDEFNNIKESCVSRVAIEAKNLSICQQVTVSEKWNDMEEPCYTVFAVDKQDFNICESIQNNKEKIDCISKVAGANRDLSYCDNFTVNEEKNICIRIIAPLVKDIDACNSISNNVLKGACLRGVDDVINDARMDEYVKKVKQHWIK